MTSLSAVRAGGDVKRFHTMTMLREHLVSSHSWGVAVILCDIIPTPSVALLKAALYHDVAEHVTGDISAVTKWRFPEFSAVVSGIEQQVEKELGIDVQLTEEEQSMLKFADMVDLVLCCAQECSLGNATARAVVRRGLTYLEDRAWSSPCRAYLVAVKLHVKEILNER